MVIHGLQKLTLLDYPGHTACTVFTAHCPWRCPFCHNPALVLPDRETDGLSTEELLAFLETRRGKLDGVCVTGGEPLLQPGIDELITALGALGYRVEIETNGSVSLQPFASLSFRPCFTMDYKLPGSGMEQTMLPV